MSSKPVAVENLLIESWCELLQRDSASPFSIWPWRYLLQPPIEGMVSRRSIQKSGPYFDSSANKQLPTKRFWFWGTGRLDARVVSVVGGAWKEVGGEPIGCGE